MTAAPVGKSKGSSMTQGEANDELDELFDESVLQPGMVLEYKGVMWRFNPKWKKDIIAAILSLLERRELEARIDTLKEAKRIVLRRTEIPKDARNPTRDQTVIIGEACADAIQHYIEEAELSQLRNPGGGKGSE